MNPETYAAEHAVVETHWWFVGRRRLFARLIGGLGLGPHVPILDVGTSAGTNLLLCRSLGFTSVRGLDISPEAIGYCAARGLPPVDLGSIEAMPYGDASFSLVLATDVLEHVDDARALAEIRRVLVPGGRVLMTVPAFPALWGTQDDVSHHRRRYRLRPLLDLVRAAGLVPETAFYFNYLLFAPIWAARRLIRVTRQSIRSENDLNTAWLNRVLTWIFGVDIRTAPILRPPFGVSVAVVARSDRLNDSRGPTP
ncbi:MAG: class I SAM-dependent methyltransferase [Alphaproteobacteria bacterium]